MLKYFKKYLWLILFSFILLNLMTIIILQIPLFVGHYFDVVFTKFDKNKFIFFIIALIIFNYLTPILSVVIEVVNKFISHQTSFQIKKHSLNYYLSQSNSFFLKYSSGFLINKYYELDNLCSFFSIKLLTVITEIIKFIYIIIMIFIVNTKLALLTIPFLPIALFLIIKRNNSYKATSKDIMNAHSDFQENLTETFNLIELIKNYNKEKYQINKLLTQINKLRRLEINQNKNQLLLNTLIQITTATTSIVIMFFGGLEYFNNQLTLGQFIAYNSYLKLLFDPLNSLANNFLQFSRISITYTRLKEVIFSSPLSINPQVKSYLKPEIFLKDISFSYNGNKAGEFCLEINELALKEKEKVQIKGPSGSGKSTLFKLILKEYEIKKGNIILGGIDYSHIKEKQVKRMISIVNQNILLLNDTIYNNLIWANPEASMEEIKRVLKIVDIYDFVEQLPDKLNYKLCENGRILSGGQRQKLNIARALLRKSPIYLFDEPDNSIDVLSFTKIMNNIESYLTNSASIFISHHLPEKYFDRTISFYNGKLIQN